MHIGPHSHLASSAVIKQQDDFIMGAYCNVLDYSLISPKTSLGNFCLIDRLCIIAGSNFRFTMEDFSGIGGSVTIWCQSNDYVNNLISMNAQIKGDVTLKKYSGIGAGSVVMPNNIIPEGTAIGANSFIPSNFEFQEWTVYAGNPLRIIKPRNKESVLREAEELAKLLEK